MCAAVVAITMQAVALPLRRPTCCLLTRNCSSDTSRDHFSGWGDALINREQ